MEWGKGDGRKRGKTGGERKMVKKGRQIDGGREGP